MYIDAYIHIQHTPFGLFITWQLVSTSCISHHQAIVQEHECIQKLSNIRQEISPFFITKALKIYVQFIKVQSIEIGPRTFKKKLYVYKNTKHQIFR
jgi:hypothetical protein